MYMSLANLPFSEPHPMCDITHQYSYDIRGVPNTMIMPLLSLKDLKN